MIHPSYNTMSDVIQLSVQYSYVVLQVSLIKKIYLAKWYLQRYLTLHKHIPFIVDSFALFADCNLKTVSSD